MQVEGDEQDHLFQPDRPPRGRRSPVQVVGGGRPSHCSGSAGDHRQPRHVITELEIHG